MLRLFYMRVFNETTEQSVSNTSVFVWRALFKSTPLVLVYSRLFSSTLACSRLLSCVLVCSVSTLIYVVLKSHTVLGKSHNYDI